MQSLKTILFAGLLSLVSLSTAQAEDYILDTEGTHAFIQFKIKHLGFSWLYGQFNQFSGNFSYDEANPTASKINVEIDVSSLYSNHAKRDKHLRSDAFLDVKAFPTATFVSTSFKETGEDTAIVQGDFTLHGVTKNITLNVEHIGHGKDPWGGYRRGFYGTTSIKPAEFGLKDMDKLGPHSTELFLELSIEGIRQSESDNVLR
jgi:polyisoprenoid-binding protein YceI